MKIYKFVVPTGKWTTDPEEPHLQWRGCAAACVANSEEDARAHLLTFAEYHGHDTRWLRAATVHELPITDHTMILWVQE